MILDLQDYYKNHYLYEIYMLGDAFKAHNMLPNLKELKSYPCLLPVLKNATLESFLMHCRCLIEFFYIDELGGDKYKDKKNKQFSLEKVSSDYVAQHYIPEWQQIRNSIKTRRNNWNERFDEISKQLSHLSRKRKKDSKYPHDDIHHDIMLLHKAFIKNLPEEYEAIKLDTI